MGQVIGVQVGGNRAVDKEDHRHDQQDRPEQLAGGDGAVVQSNVVTGAGGLGLVAGDSAFGDNLFADNNGGNANPQTSGGISTPADRTYRGDPTTTRRPWT